MELEEVKSILENLHEKYNRIDFIEQDPISIPHKFTKKEDVEISGFLSAILAWGQRSQIILKANTLVELMDYSPADFVMNAGNYELQRFNKFYYRTFQAVDATFFIRALQYIYKKKNGLEGVFNNAYEVSGNVKKGIEDLHSIFTSVEHESRSMKHLANVSKGSSAKRINMFLRWMVRADGRGVDFGIWKKIPSSSLYLPLDVHTGRTARLLSLLKRKQNDWKSVEEVTGSLRKLDNNDPIKYDYALFGAGIDKVI